MSIYESKMQAGNFGNLEQFFTAYPQIYDDFIAYAATGELKTDASFDLDAFVKHLLLAFDGVTNDGKLVFEGQINEIGASLVTHGVSLSLLSSTSPPTNPPTGPTPTPRRTLMISSAGYEKPSVGSIQTASFPSSARTAISPGVIPASIATTGPMPWTRRSATTRSSSARFPILRSGTRGSSGTTTATSSL